MSEPTAPSVMESFPTQVWGLTRDYQDRDPAVPTENAMAILVLTDREDVDDESGTGDEFPTENAQVRFSFRDSVLPSTVEGPPPSDAADAELWLSPESAGARVPGKHARQLLDVATHAVTAAAIVWGPQATLEMTDVSLAGWAIMLIVFLQLGGVVWFGRKLVQRRR